MLAIGIVVLFGGIAYASIPDSGGVIHACYQSPPPSGGANLQVIDTDAGGHCSGGKVELTWNQVGPQGPTGATGATGATGPQGAPVQFYRVRDHYETLGNFVQGGRNYNVVCDEGDYVIGGLFDPSPDSQSWWTDSSLNWPTDSRTWYFNVNFNNPNHFYSFDLVATCADYSPYHA